MDPFGHPAGAVAARVLHFALELRAFVTGYVYGGGYKPLRHPTAPSLSRAGVWLVIPDLAVGLPVLRALSLWMVPRRSSRHQREISDQGGAPRWSPLRSA